ncbi:MAG: PilZ domain-containing protein [Candidatus Omnitrophica bacterium]|nr:PilZ domain-containing protein [Candidatus Omnitrophota bacterium]
METQNLRRESRYNSDLPAQIRIGEQLTLNGRLKDISLKSAFIRIRENVFLKLSDEIGFAFPSAPGNEHNLIQGMARISRIVAGEGFAFYFTKMEDESMSRLKKLLDKSSDALPSFSLET